MLLLAGGALCVYATRGTTFADDEWTWIFDRRSGGLRTWLAPHNVHLSLVPVAVYKLLFATAGLRTYVPYRLVVVGAHLVCAGLVFTLARRRVGPRGALAAALVILTLGPASEAFLWPFNMTFLFAVDAGLGALLMLERRSTRADVAASVLVGVSLASAGPGVAFACGAAVEVLGRRRPRDLWIVGAPAMLYAVWWARYQGSAGTLTPGAVPGFAVRAAAAASGALCGLSGANSVTGGHWLRFGLPLLLLGAVLLTARAWAARGVGWRLVGLGAMAIVFWVTVGLGRGALRLGPIVLAASGHEGRYLYISAVLIVLIAVEVAALAPAPRPRWWPSVPGRARRAAGTLALAAVCAAVVSNLIALRDGAAVRRTSASLARAGLGVIKLTRTVVPPSFAPAGFAFGIVTAGQYLAADRALGPGPAASATEIVRDPELVRETVDSELARIDRLRVAPQAAGGCRGGRTVAAGAVIPLPRSGVTLAPAGTGALLMARRFAEGYTGVGTTDGAGAEVRARPDGAPRPWQLTSDGPVRICR